MRKDDQLFLGHILDAANHATNLVRGKSRDDLNHDMALRFALPHLVQIIGEAARRLSAEFMADHPEIPWKTMIGMRHKIVHDYFGVDMDLVWKTVTEELPPLLSKLQKIVP